MSPDPSAMELARLASGAETPLAALFVRSLPVTYSDCLATGSLLDVIPLLAHSTRRLFRWLRRDSLPIQVVAVFTNRIELLVWQGSLQSQPESRVVCDQSGRRRVYVGHEELRLSGHDWRISVVDRVKLVEALQGSAWRQRLTVF